MDATPHIGLIRQNRLIAGVNFMDELTPNLRNGVLLIKDKEGSGTTYDDAVELAKYERLTPHTTSGTGW
jgi:hypothetical protein